MKVRLGIIAPRQSEAVFASCADQLEGIQTRWLLYETDEEIASLVDIAKDSVDALFFAGPLAFDRCRSLIPPTVPVAVARLRAIDVALSLLKAREEGLPLGPVSIDTFDARIVTDVLSELGAEDALASVRPYQPGDSVEAIVEFHLQARAGGARYAITGRSGVYATLQGLLGPDVIQSVPVPATISAAMNEVVLRTVSARHSQLRFSAALFKLFNEANMYETEVLRLNVSRLLMESPELEEAWVEDRGDRTLAVFAHKGLMEDITQTWTTVPIIDEARAKYGIELAVGFGVAESARRTIRHAEMALRRAESEHAPVGYLFTDDGLVIGPMHGAGEPLRYAFKAETAELTALSERAGLGVTTLSRLSDLERRLAGSAASADEIGAALRVSATSGRRIIRALVEAALAQPVGIAQPAKRGRPKRLYRLQLEEQIKGKGPAGR